MAGFREVSPDEESAHTMLAEYFADRATSFPDHLGTYTATFPDPAAFVPPNGVFLVLEDVDLAGEPADVGCGGIRRLPPGENGLDRFEVKHLYLRPFLRGRGFGRLMLTELERRAAEFGAQEIVLDTNSVLEAAGGLYRASGYRDIEPYNSNPNATNWYGKQVVVG